MRQRTKCPAVGHRDVLPSDVLDQAVAASLGWVQHPQARRELIGDERPDHERAGPCVATLVDPPDIGIADSSHQNLLFLAISGKEPRDSPVGRLSVSCEARDTVTRYGKVAEKTPLNHLTTR